MSNDQPRVLTRLDFSLNALTDDGFVSFLDSISEEVLLLLKRAKASSVERDLDGNRGINNIEKGADVGCDLGGNGVPDASLTD